MTEIVSPWLVRDSEREVLGAMLCDPSAAQEAVGRLVPDDFWGEPEREMFEVMAEAVEAGREVDHRIVARRLEDGRASRPREFPPLVPAEVLAASIGPSALDRHILLVQDAAVRRALRAACVEALRSADEPGISVQDCVARYSAALERANDRLAGQRGDTSFRSVLEEIWAAIDHPSGPGYDTGLPELDAVLGGIAPGELCVVAARPGGGKTTFIAGLARRWAGGGVPVLFASYEMGKAELGRIFLAGQVKVCFHKDGTIEDPYSRAVTDALNDMRGLPIIVDPYPGPLSQLVGYARQQHRRGACGALFVDYLQLVPADRRADTREQEVSATSRGLKMLAKELSIPVVVAAQLNRQGADEPKRPALSRLRESGAIEQDADIVVFLWSSLAEQQGLEWSVTASVAKNRNGEVGEADLKWQRGFRYFTDARGLDPRPMHIRGDADRVPFTVADVLSHDPADNPEEIPF